MCSCLVWSRKTTSNVSRLLKVGFHTRSFFYTDRDRQNYAVLVIMRLGLKSRALQQKQAHSSSSNRCLILSRKTMLNVSGLVKCRFPHKIIHLRTGMDRIRLCCRSNNETGLTKSSVTAKTSALQ